MDKVDGYLEIGTNDRDEVVINLDRDRTGHICFSRNQTIALIANLHKQVMELDSRIRSRVVIEDVRGAVARGWCAPKNQNKVMDCDLAEAIANEVMILVNAP